MTGHLPKADRLPQEFKALLPQPLPVNARGETERKHFTIEALDLCFEWFRAALAPLAAAASVPQNPSFWRRSTSACSRPRAG